MVTWILEKDIFDEECFDNMTEHFKDTNIPYHVVRVIPFIHEIEDDKVPKVKSNCIVYGSIGIQVLAERHGWLPGVWASEKFNENIIQKKLGTYYLNYDAVVVPFKDSINKVVELGLKEFFIKPNTDSKEFAGTVQTVDELESWMQNILDINYIDNMDFDVAISTPKGIGKEWRNVIVNGEVVASSLYRNYRKLYMEEGAPKNVIDFVENMIQIYSPDDVFIIDVIESDDGLKVIEYGTFNSAGLYKCDVKSIINKINIFVEKRRN